MQVKKYVGQSTLQVVRGAMLKPFPLGMCSWQNRLEYRCSIGSCNRLGEGQMSL